MQAFIFPAQALHEIDLFYQQVYNFFFKRHNIWYPCINILATNKNNMGKKAQWQIYSMVFSSDNTSLYPLAGDYAGFPGCGLLRLHSTYRHDLKIYASDEGRVQMTAAAFAKVKKRKHARFLLSTCISHIHYI